MKKDKTEKKVDQEPKSRQTIIGRSNSETRFDENSGSLDDETYSKGRKKMLDGNMKRS